MSRLNHAVIDSAGRPIKEGLPGEIRRWLKENEWALMFRVRKGESGPIVRATEYMGRL